MADVGAWYNGNISQSLVFRQVCWLRQAYADTHAKNGLILLFLRMEP